jgi:hypothetical protein
MLPEKRYAGLICRALRRECGARMRVRFHAHPDNLVAFQASVGNISLFWTDSVTSELIDSPAKQAAYTFEEMLSQLPGAPI